MVSKKKRILGWTGVVLSTLLSGVWAYWGAIENFHEGWYSKSILENLFMLFCQYLIVAISFIVLALVAIRWKKIGLALYITAGLGCACFFSGAEFSVVGVLIVIPFAILAFLSFFGDPVPRKWAYALILLVPLLIITAISIPQGIKVSQRSNDGDLGMRVVEGNGVVLAWAPRGPGWPDHGVTWEEAQRICRYLSEDGTILTEEEQNVWRLPTVDEAVRSMMLHGENAGGLWDGDKETVYYDLTPDKESPLWDVHSRVIYYWTADISKTDSNQAYIIVYHGGVYDKPKSDGQDYLSFRAVKDAN